MTTPPPTRSSPPSSLIAGDRDATSTHKKPGEFGWCARGDRIPCEQRVPFNRPTLRQVVKAIPFVMRYFVYWLKHWRRKETLFINTFQPLQHKPHYGVPCGTIGSGSIGRDFRGGFCKFGLRPGLIEHHVDVLRADQFIVTLRRVVADSPSDASSVYQKVLCAVPFPNEKETIELGSWDFTFPPDQLTYRGLYPRSWTCYRIPEHKITIKCRQISPVIPHDYQNSSLPVAVFVFDVSNDSSFDYDVSITFTFRNGTGHEKWRNEGDCKSTRFDQQPAHSTTGVDLSKVNGVCLEHTISGMRCTYAIGASVNPGECISVCRRFHPSRSGFCFWQNLQHTGTVLDVADEASACEMGVAVCVKRRVPAFAHDDEASIEFALAWDMPRVQFGNGQRQYRRRYTRFFGDAGDAGARLCAHALASYREWERRIEEWQAPVLNHPHLPDWYKSALYNELYFITDGGSIWFEYDDNWHTDESHLSAYSRALMKNYGRFGYLESWEYRMVNTYDVHFYASFALAQLWPHLEHALQAEFTDHIDHSDSQSVIFHMEGDRAPTKLRNRVPHDLGNPAVDPWLQTNAYVMHDTGKWKDLNLKFVLTSYRDWVCLLNRDRDFLQLVWPAIKNLLNEALEHWDRDGDGMIENFGKADQTYDAWKMSGVSAYCGSLWLASLRVAVLMAKAMGALADEQRFADVLIKARAVYEHKLWNGWYYDFDERSLSRRTIMADQLCGFWFLHSVDPEAASDLLPAEHVRRALTTVFEFNVLRFANGRLGAVNGMRFDGTVDHHYIQADEMWTGVTYALAAFLIQQGKVQDGFDTAWGCYDACFNRFGLQYQTPEALYEHRFYRAIGYMRPLSIWAMQWALERHCRIFEEGNSDCLKGLRTGPSPLATLLAPTTPEELAEEREEMLGHSDTRSPGKPGDEDGDRDSMTPSTSGCSSGGSRSLSEPP